MRAHPVSRSMIVLASSKRVASPRNLLMTKPLASARSLGGSSAQVPTRLAITPPRSTSPTSATGTCAASAKPMLAMSFSRRFTSAGLPAPSTRIRSAPRPRREKLSSTRGISAAFIA